MLRVTAILIT